MTCVSLLFLLPDVFGRLLALDNDRALNSSSSNNSNSRSSKQEQRQQKQQQQRWQKQQKQKLKQRKQRNMRVLILWRLARLFIVLKCFLHKSYLFVRDCAGTVCYLRFFSLRTYVSFPELLYLSLIFIEKVEMIQCVCQEIANKGKRL